MNMPKTSNNCLSYEQILEYVSNNLDLIKPFVLNDVVELCSKVDEHFMKIRIDVTYSKFHVLYFIDECYNITNNIEVFKKFIKKQDNYYYSELPAKRTPYEVIDSEILLDIPQTNDEWFNLLMTDDLSQEYFLKFKEIIVHCEKLLGFA